MRVKVLKDKNGRYFVQVPREIWELGKEGLELFKLREGFYLLTVPLNVFYVDKKNLLKKILDIVEKDREVMKVKSYLSEKERLLFDKLVSDGYIVIKQRHVFLTEKGLSVVKSNKEFDYYRKDNKIEVVDLSRGFAVVDGESFPKLRSFLEENKGYIRYLIDVMSGKLFIAKREFLKKYGKKIMTLLSKGEMSAYEIAERLKIGVDAVDTVAKFLNEEGLIYEKDGKRKVYALVG